MIGRLASSVRLSAYTVVMFVGVQVLLALGLFVIACVIFVPIAVALSWILQHL